MRAETSIGDSAGRKRSILTTSRSSSCEGSSASTDPEDVDELTARVRKAGGKLTKDLVDAEFFAGRDAYFVDPEGNFWEIAYAPPDNPVVFASRRAAGNSSSRTRGGPAPT